jgi:YD repeat-containing protein
VGNRTLKVEDGARTTLVYDACNQLLTSEDAGGTTTFTYDENGNQTVVQKPSGARTTQVWDYENRLVKTIQPSGGVTSMSYDADGLRLKKEDATGTKLFMWDDQNYLAETDAAGTTETAFTTEPSSRSVAARCCAASRRVWLAS